MTPVLDKPLAKPAADERRYGSAATSAAAGIDRKTFNNWLSRTPAVILLSDEERRDVGERSRFSFDFRRVVQIALTAEFVRLGLQPRRATLCAACFTDMSDEANEQLGIPERLPGQLYDGAYTFLVVSSQDDFANVVPVLEGTTVIDLMAPLYGPAFGTAIMVRVNDIVDRVRSVLHASAAED